jgi:hypothetical protein
VRGDALNHLAGIDRKLGQNQADGRENSSPGLVAWSQIARVSEGPKIGTVRNSRKVNGHASCRATWSWESAVPKDESRLSLEID